MPAAGPTAISFTMSLEAMATAHLRHTACPTNAFEFLLVELALACLSCQYRITYTFERITETVTETTSESSRPRAIASQAVNSPAVRQKAAGYLFGAYETTCIRSFFCAGEKRQHRVPGAPAHTSRASAVAQHCM